MGLFFKKSTAQPSFSVAAAITGTVEATQTLTCAYTVIRCRAQNVTVRWYRHTASDGSDPTGVQIATGTAYTLTGTDVGHYIRAIVTAINPAGTVSSTTSYTAIITSGDPPVPPVLVTPAAITGTADVGETLTVTYSFTGQDSVAIQWYSFASEPTGNPLTGDDPVSLGTASTQALTETEAGRWIGVTVTATNTVDSTETSAIVPMDGVDPYAPIAPAQYTVPTYDDSAMEKIYAYEGDDLQAKLNLLRPGKCLVLGAGATWTGNYNIDPAITLLDGSDWAYIITSDMAGLPAEGTRVTAADVSHMPKIQCGTYVDGSGKTQSTNSVSENGTIRIYDGTKKLRLVGLEITTAYSAWNAAEGRLVSIGRYGSGVGSDIVIERCYIHGNPTGNNQDGIVAYSGVSSLAIKDCTFDYFKSTAEAHAVHILSGRGPTLIHNNSICAAGINVFLRDSDSTQTIHPEDVTITKNYIWKRLEWDNEHPSWIGVNLMCKNLIESKGSKRVLVRGNVFKDAWNDDQAGKVWFCQNYAEGISDVDFRDNLAVNTGVSIELANPFDNGRGYGWERMRFYNNLFANSRASTDYLNQVQLGDVGSGFGRYLTVKNNTWVYYNGLVPGALMYFNSSANPSGIEHMIVEDNIFRQSVSWTGVGANGMGSGRATAAVHVDDFDFNKNVSVGNSLSQYSTTYADWRNWKSGDTGGIWGNSNVGYVNTAFTELGHFALSEASQFKNNGTDGQDIGCDITALAAQINASDNPFGA